MPKKSKYVKTCAICGNPVEPGGVVRLFVRDENQEDNCLALFMDGTCAAWFLAQRNLKGDGKCLTKTA